jgi:light-regulated signal transduction histidine kinase (bacteriophytochrome)
MYVILIWRMASQIEQGDIARLLTEQEIQKLNSSLSTRSMLLEAANNELEAFSYSVSHDLRAPLRSLDGFSQALAEDYRDVLDAQGKDFLDRISASAQRMGHLIDDLLSLGRVTRSEMRRVPVDLSALANGIISELQMTEPARRVHVEVTPGLVANGDSSLLRVALQNLLANAWKFTRFEETATIEFSATEQNGEHVFFVRDNGAGFDMAYADKLFGAFQRLHAMNEFPGTGVGLATVQRILFRHGGRAWVDAAVGVGATFFFTIGDYDESDDSAG